VKTKKITSLDPYRLAPVFQFEKYCGENPHSPSAIVKPNITLRGGFWFALLGSGEHGILGIGQSVHAALQAFDHEYVSPVRRPYT
jgi:hypothetical protein